MRKQKVTEITDNMLPLTVDFQPSQNPERQSQPKVFSRIKLSAKLIKSKPLPSLFPDEPYR